MTIGSTFEFAEDLARRARRKGVRRVVIDVRRNGGGNNSTYGSLVQALRTGPLARRGLSVLLTSRITYSAASNFVGEVDARTRTRIVGEGAGGSPNNYGDRRQVELPSLGWTVYVAPQYVEVVRGDRRTEVRPDVPVALTARAYFAGRDPVLARAISLR
jgi:C-terminal processing protease CtpA/Prc